MVQLLLTALAISMMSASLVMTTSYVNANMAQSQQLSIRLEGSFLELKKGRDAYVAAHAFEPNELEQIAPSYVFLPAAPKGLSWSMGSGGAANQGRYFCLSGDSNSVTLHSLERLNRVFSPQAYFISDSCGSVSNGVPSIESGTAPIAVTLWVSSYT